MSFNSRNPPPPIKNTTQPSANLNTISVVGPMKTSWPTREFNRILTSSETINYRDFPSNCYNVVTDDNIALLFNNVPIATMVLLDISGTGTVTVQASPLQPPSPALSEGVYILVFFMDTIRYQILTNPV